MESRKNKMKRIFDTILDITKGKVIKITDDSNENHIFICQQIKGNCDLYDFTDKKRSWGLACENIDDLRDAILKDYVDGLITNIKIM